MNRRGFLKGLTVGAGIAAAPSIAEIKQLPQPHEEYPYILKELDEYQDILMSMSVSDIVSWQDGLKAIRQDLEDGA